MFNVRMASEAFEDDDAPETCAECGEVLEPGDAHQHRDTERDEDDPYPDRVMVDASGKPHYEP
jgi:hypothetical protein